MAHTSATTATRPGVNSREKVYSAIWKHWTKFYMHPTVAWLAAECGGMSTNTISHHIKALVAEERILKVNRHPVPKEIAEAIRGVAK